MDALRHGNFRLAAVLALVVAFGVAGCGGSDGDDGAQGPRGMDGTDGSDGVSCWDLNANGVADPEEDLNGDGTVDVLDCTPSAGTGIVIGDGGELTDEEIDELGQLVATIDDVTIASPPVVEFTVVDSNGNPAVGIAEGVVWFTAAKLVPGTAGFNGGLPYWQSYVNRIETPGSGNTPNVLQSAVQATTDSQGSLEELGAGKYRYTFANDITNITSPIAVAYEPDLLHRIGLEIRLDGPGEVPLAPDNPVFDFVPSGATPAVDSKAIAETANCNDCHFSFALHGGPRKTVEYCVTCHNPRTIDQDTGDSLDMAYMAHSIHTPDRGPSYIIYGFGNFIHDYSHVTYPQSQTFCETCHTESADAPDGDVWITNSSAKTCGGCHADGLQTTNPDAVTGVPAYAFNHVNSDVPSVGVAQDGSCSTCHAGAISSAGPALAIHSSIRGDQRARTEAGDNFVLEILGATNTGAGETPVITFRVDDPQGNAYDIVNDPEFTQGGASLNLYVGWSSDEIFNGLADGTSTAVRDQGAGSVPYASPAHPNRMYLAALQRDAVQNADGSYTVTFFAALPAELPGAPVIALGGHPRFEYTDADGVTAFDNAYAVSQIFYTGTPRDTRFASENCNACHERLAFHGGNRSGNYEMCLVCHNNDLAVTEDFDGDGVAEPEGFGFGYMIHSIHRASPTFVAGGFAEVTYPQQIDGCETCHTPGGFSTAREEARAVSTSEGVDPANWQDDVATTANAATCGTCHTSNAAIGHFKTNGGFVDATKDPGLLGNPPTGQEACAVCHGAGSLFDTALFHEPGPL